MIQIQNQQGATVNIITDQQPKRKKWVKKWHAFGLYFAVANCRIQKRWGDRPMSEKGRNDIRDIKNQLYKKQKHVCPLCQQEHPYKYMELHHKLPWPRFPELRMKHRNLVMLCHDCHKEVHCNPFLNIRMMKEAAQHFGIDLKDRYDYDETDCPQEPAGQDNA